MVLLDDENEALLKTRTLLARELAMESGTQVYCRLRTVYVQYPLQVDLPPARALSSVIPVLPTGTGTSEPTVSRRIKLCDVMLKPHHHHPQ
jgi:hypothetical protein